MTLESKKLQERLQDRTARVAVIGLGYVGLPLICEFAAVGFQTVGIDIDPDRVQDLTDGLSPVVTVTDEQLRNLQDRLEFTTSHEEVRECDVSVICVPTPFAKQQPDLSIVIDVIQSIQKILPENHLVVLESSVYPGATEEVIRPILETRERRIGVNLFLGYSPERIDPNNALFGLKNTPKLISGSTPACTKAMQSLYESVVDEIVVVSSPTVAEAAKLFENAYRLVNISLANEFALLCKKMNISVWEVIGSAATKPFGFKAFSPGLGAGGHCIPVTPLHLAWKAREQNVPIQIIEMARDVNNRMPEYAALQISDILNQFGSSLKEARILVLGVAYKAGLSDIRNSPAFVLMQHLLDRGAQVLYHDFFVPNVRIGTVQLNSVTSLDRELKDADIVVVATDHPGYDWERIESAARHIFDTRGVFRHSQSSKVTML